MAGLSDICVSQRPPFFSFEPGAKWHGFEGYAADQYFVDPCKLLLTTPGINAETGEYSDFGVPATILAHYLGERHCAEVRSQLHSVLINSGGKPREAGTTGRDVGAV
ncbi:hypothetical protein ACVXG8_17930 [Escherichia coli]